MYQEKKSFILQRLPSYKPHLEDGIGSKPLLLEASTIFYKLANVFAPNFHEFSVTEVVSTFRRVEVVIN